MNKIKYWLLIILKYRVDPEHRLTNGRPRCAMESDLTAFLVNSPCITVLNRSLSAASSSEMHLRKWRSVECFSAQLLGQKKSWEGTVKKFFQSNLWNIFRRYIKFCRYRHAKKVDKKEEFGNSVYKVAFTRGARDPPRIFGATYHFQLEEQVDVEEFLVFQPVFADICREYGLEGKS